MVIFPDASIPTRPPMPPRSTRDDGDARRSFIAGNSECPPASSFASGSAARRLAAACTLSGLWYSNWFGNTAIPPSSSLSKRISNLVAGLAGRRDHRLGWRVLHVHGTPDTLGRVRHVQV